VETALLAALAGTAKNRGAQSLIGEFIPTQKNQVIADFLPNNGFTKESGANARYQKMLNEDFDSPSYFKVEFVN
jgi:predicted enzyme involved in methoxymalonyl-ACP biosynthesis